MLLASGSSRDPVVVFAGPPERRRMLQVPFHTLDREELKEKRKHFLLSILAPLNLLHCQGTHQILQATGQAAGIRLALCQATLFAILTS